MTKAPNGTDIEFIWKTPGKQTGTATYVVAGVNNEAVTTSLPGKGYPAAVRSTYAATGVTNEAIAQTTQGVNSFGYYKENTNTANLKNLTEVNITTMVKAGDSLSILDAALDKVAQMRSDLGAIENRLAYTVSNLMNIAEKTAGRQITPGRCRLCVGVCKISEVSGDPASRNLNAFSGQPDDSASS